MKDPVVCWFKHGPYEENESMSCVFNDPKDADCYSPLTWAKESKEIQAGSEKAEQRRVVCAANIFPDGTLLIGIRHWDFLMDEQFKRKTIPWKRLNIYKEEQGFIDQFGKFMSREEALAVALAAGQRIYRCGGDSDKLYSENLY